MQQRVALLGGPELVNLLIHPPDADELVTATCQQGTAVTAEGHGQHPSCVSSQDFPSDGPPHVPDTEGLVLAPGDEPVGLGVVVDGEDGQLVPGQQGEQTPVLHVPDSTAGVVRHRNKEGTVRDKHDAVDVSCMPRPSRRASSQHVPQLSTGSLPDPDASIRRGCGQQASVLRELNLDHSFDVPLEVVESEARVHVQHEAGVVV
mmetsp:Transcript_16000/g.53619  ORF Transcript_16000/g.53619 Transcript_16000/m.53619 type:complete len:204 (-) Transcript_16000:3863-4474(-)